MKKLMYFLSFLMMTTLVACEKDIDQEIEITIPPDVKIEGIQIINQNIEKGEPHSDIVFGMAYNPVLMRVVKPTVTVSIEGCEPYTVSLDEGKFDSAVNSISFKAYHISIMPKSLDYWWVGIQRTGHDVKGEMSVSFTKETTDYSSFPENTELSFNPFVCAAAVKADIIISSLNYFDITIGKITPLEEQVDNLVKETHIVKFDTAD